MVLCSDSAEKKQQAKVQVNGNLQKMTNTK